MTGLNYEQKQLIDNKFMDLLVVFRDSLNQSIPMAGTISDSSLIKDDIIFLTEETLRESKYINEAQQAVNERIGLINDKLTNEGKNLSDAERSKLLSDLANLDQMLKANEIQFLESQANFKSALGELRNNLLNIEELEGKLSASELQRRAEQKAFRKKLLIVVAVISGLVIFTLLLLYIIQKFNRQKKALGMANAEIERINDNLEDLVTQKTETLRRVNKELDTFLYKSSHDLRRPLTSIIGLANIAKLTMNEEAYELFAKTVKTALDMDKFLKKLLMVGHINYPTDYSEIHFPELIDKVSNEFKEVIEEKGILVTYDISKDIQYSSYPILVEIIIKNLFENALFYSSFGEDEKPKVNVTVRKEGLNLYLSIKDNGEGISEDVRNKVWNMFYVGNEKSTGNGLGLYITNRAVKELNGGISFNTKEGKFTQFSVELPFKKKVARNKKSQKKKLEKLQLTNGLSKTV